MTRTIPGIRIYQCPNCETLYRSIHNYIIVSYSNFGYQEIWSDGNVNRATTSCGFAECNICGYFFNCHKRCIGTVEGSNKPKKGNFIPEIKQSIQNDLIANGETLDKLSELSLKRFSAFLQSDGHDDYDEVNIRMCIWWQYNNLNLDLKTFQKKYKWDDENEKLKTLEDIRLIENEIDEYKDLNLGNLKQLDYLVQDNKQDRYILRAEIKRHLSNFRDCRKMLLKISIKEYHLVKQFRRQIRKKDPYIFEITDRLNTKCNPFEYYIEKMRKVLGIA